MKRKQIKNVFTKLGKEQLELWFSGEEKEGEYKKWYSNGQIYIHAFYKNGKTHGEYKIWWSDGNIWHHKLLKDGEIVKDYLA